MGLGRLMIIFTTKEIEMLSSREMHAKTLVSTLLSIHHRHLTHSTHHSLSSGDS